MSTVALFTAEDLSGFLHQTVSAEDAAVTEQVVWGWLSGAVGLDTRPDPVPADLFSWAVELGAMAYENPTSLTVRQVDDVRMESTEARREAILAAVSQSSDVSSGGGPQGSFVEAEAWPDPPFGSFGAPARVIYVP